MAKSSEKDEIAQLREEIEHLKRQLSEARTYKRKNSEHKWKSFFKWLSLALAGLVFIFGTTIFYVATTLVNTDKFMGVAGPLARQPAVQTAVAQKTTDALFSQIDVESLATQALPPRADFLAPTLAIQLEKTTRDKAGNIVASEQFQQVWNNSVRSAHETFVKQLKDYQGDGTISLDDVYKQLSQRLKGGKLSFLANKSLPPKIGSVTVVQADWLPAAHKLVANINLLRALAIFVLLGLLALAIWLSEKRRKAIIQIGAMVSILSALMLVSLRIIRNLGVDNVQPAYQQAAIEAWKVFIKPFAVELVIFIILGLATIFVAWVSGRSPSAISFRGRAETLFAGKLHESIFKQENAFTLWVGRHRRLLFTLVAVIFIASLLFISLTVKSFIVLLTGVVVLSVLIEGFSGEPSAFKTP